MAVDLTQYNLDDLGYVFNKATSLNESGYQGRTDWDTESVLAAFEEAGLTPESHYETYGINEGIGWGMSGSNTGTTTAETTQTPEDTYSQSLADWFNTNNITGEYVPDTGWTSDLAQGVIDSVGGTQAHYDNYGASQGLTYEPEIENQMTMFGEDISNLETGSYSGLPEEYNTQLLDALIPQLIESFSNYRTDIDNSTNAAQELYSSMARQALEEDAQNVLNDLSSRNIFSGTVASDTLAKGQTDIAKEYANKGYETAMTAAAMKAGEPAMLGSIAGLGNTSESFNELAPYELLINSYLEMQ